MGGAGEPQGSLIRDESAAGGGRLIFERCGLGVGEEALLFRGEVAFLGQGFDLLDPSYGHGSARAQLGDGERHAVPLGRGESVRLRSHEPGPGVRGDVRKNRNFRLSQDFPLYLVIKRVEPAV